MHSFAEAYRSSTTGVFDFFDRVLLRGSFLQLSHEAGMLSWLNWKHILLKDFGAFVMKQSDAVKEHGEQIAKKAGRPFHYMASSAESKEKFVERMIREEKLTDGLVCVLRAVEPCKSFTIRKDAETKHLKLAYEERKCLFLYFYFIDREFGLMHVRLQTWFPFPIQVCINGREWVSRHLDRAGIGYTRSDNCFLAIDDPVRAQRIADELVNTHWPKVLDRFAKIVNPLLKTILDDKQYYWTIRQSEYATDVMFTSPQALKKVYPGFVRFAMDTFGSEDVMRFLGRKLVPQFKGEIVSVATRRVEGFRVRHSVYENSIKMYDKQGSVLRIETTINNPKRFKSYRRNTQGEMDWLPMRKGVADVLSRVQMCRAANLRYLDALAGLAEKKKFSSVLDPVSKPLHVGKARFRPLRPVSREDAALFALILRAEFLLHGFRNVDIRSLLYGGPTRREAEVKRRAGQVTRLLRLLRAHGLIKKIPRTSRYRATRSGIRLMETSLGIRKSDMRSLSETA
jgi:hypothetical protein